MFAPARLLLVITVALFVQPCFSRLTLPLKTSTIAKSLMSPCGVGVDGAGALIVSACEFCGIYKILRNGTTTVVAGVIGICGTTDGIGSIARFYYPSSVATDAQQNVAYITDQGNSRIRAMDLLTYNVTTVTGSSANYREGAFSTALFNYCSGVIFRSTATGKVLYITDNKNNRIRKANFSSLLVWRRQVSVELDKGRTTSQNIATTMTRTSRHRSESCRRK